MLSSAHRPDGPPLHRENPHDTGGLDMKRSIFTLAVTLAIGIAVGVSTMSFVNAMQHVKVMEL
jgi:hypothetical protein